MTELCIQDLHDPKTLASLFHHDVEGTNGQLVYYPERLGVVGGVIKIDGEAQDKPSDLDERIRYAATAYEVASLLYEVSVMIHEGEGSLLSRSDFLNFSAERKVCEAVLGELVALKATERCSPPDNPCFDTDACPACKRALDDHLANEEINYRGGVA